jgi:hypothetical protein
MPLEAEVIEGDTEGRIDKDGPRLESAVSSGVLQRGKLCFAVCAGTIVMAWIAFLVSAIHR